ncbi:MAG: [FeFe] hydrogenase H-cluster maturation GTPase HydF [Solobacterium sp.]|jgi:[FeFe] hydrogenase H-cluster maturation GTPase HydF|nr:[FeFe] hydrogenase H-cluster maturation GTPase HydF [Solobacterium sp.]MCH4205043.1 [FeFe] hydrogenase H-cluster maturation GTPase HydF [Solobacterium sp.]MCH4226552.1 [FeFe] hydrogenase H-cluster maturation GTPase HydF [Solobacterium sp.]MCH4281836.1 [FeFe] hydrogenase H-cluster maturation GTPase HydF [Solobacterium sp.]
MNSIANGASSANRTHIGFFGRMNAGKSSLINALTKQPAAIVSDVAGTTTDVVKKPMEIHGIGACTLLDTAGFDDASELGKQRVLASQRAAEESDLAVILFTEAEDGLEEQWIRYFTERKIPCIGVFSKYDQCNHEKVQERIAQLEKKYQIPFSVCSAEDPASIDELKNTMIKAMRRGQTARTVLAGLAKAQDIVMLVMPQDPQAPEGRLIQPEVQTIRDALDRECIAICVTLDGMPKALASLKKAPDLIVTDSQAFRQVHELCPKESRLTSFSVLFAGLKGDIEYYAESAKAIDQLTPSSKVLIAECCTHAPMEEDIGRVKIPRLLRKKAGEDLQIDVKAGVDFPEDASQYDLIIQCGGCMFNRRYVMSRINRAKEKKVPMTNYGIAIAYLNGILDDISLPKGENND